jgi:hypothetical protein
MRTLPRSAAWRIIAPLLGGVWTLPNTMLGLAAGLAGMLRGARIGLDAGALVFHRYPWGPGGAMVLGQVILHTGESLDCDCLTYVSRAAGGSERVNLAQHERAHVLQYLALGPLFLPLYLLHGGARAENRFERAADRFAASGRGWWPWF